MASHGTQVFIGRIDESGRIVDSHRVGDQETDVRGGGTFDDEGVLTSEAYNGPSPHVLDTASDPFFVMSADPPPSIDVAEPLVTVLETSGYWAPDEPGFWYRGDTLGSEPGCGASTLYKDDADGYSRVLDATTELDLVVDVDAAAELGSGGADTVGAMRPVVISTECPDEHEGRRVYWGVERIDYGDRGPRVESPLSVSLAFDTPVAEVRSVAAIIRSIGGCCDQIAAIEIEVEQLDGARALIEVPTR